MSDRNRERERERNREKQRERDKKERDTDKCNLFIFRLASNPRYQFTLHTVLALS